MSGFANSILGGANKLIRSAIQSPNFQQSPLIGWSIDKNGNAYFQTVTIGGGVTKVTFAATAPSGSNIGDVWFDLTNGTVQYWNGGAWTNFQYGTNAIQNNAITNALLAAAAVGTSNIQNNAITAAQIADLTVTVNKFNSPTHFLF